MNIQDRERTRFKFMKWWTVTANTQRKNLLSREKRNEYDSITKNTEPFCGVQSKFVTIIGLDHMLQRNK
jgi:hypothetical protein